MRTARGPDARNPDVVSVNLVRAIRLSTLASTRMAHRRGPRTRYSPRSAKRAPITMSASASWATSTGTSRGSCWPSASTWTTASKSLARAKRKPARIAPPTPMLNGRSSTCAPCARATALVASAEPSLTTTTATSGSREWISFSTAGSEAASFQAGSTTSTRRSGAEGMPASVSKHVVASAEAGPTGRRLARRAGSPVRTSGETDTHAHPFAAGRPCRQAWRVASGRRLRRRGRGVNQGPGSAPGHTIDILMATYDGVRRHGQPAPRRPGSGAVRRHRHARLVAGGDRLRVRGDRLHRHSDGALPPARRQRGGREALERSLLQAEQAAGPGGHHRRVHGVVRAGGCLPRALRGSPLRRAGGHAAGLHQRPEARQGRAPPGAPPLRVLEEHSRPAAGPDPVRLKRVEQHPGVFDTLQVPSCPIPVDLRSRPPTRRATSRTPPALR